VVAFAALAIGATVSLAPSASAAGNPAVLSMLVMGDSYSAGNGAGFQYGPKTCWRSSHNYARQYERHVEARNGQRGFVENVACSGDHTTAFFETTVDRPPQLNAVTTGYDIIFLTTGGDDAGFDAVVKSCLVGLLRSPDACNTALSNTQRTLDARALRTSIFQVLKAIKQRAAPTAKIVLLGYPYLEGDAKWTLPYGCRRCSGRRRPPVQVGARLKALGDKGDLIQQAVVDQLNAGDPSHSFIFVKTKAKFHGPPQHELFASHVNSKRWFVQPGIDGSYSASRATFYHPNPTGWDQEAWLLWDDARIPKHPLKLPVPTACWDGSIATPPQPCPSPTNHVLSVAGGPSYFYDGTALHWIEGTETYWCLVDRGVPTIGNLQQAAVNTLGDGKPWQTPCVDPARVRGHVLHVASNNNGFFVDSAGSPHWITDGNTYDCLASGHGIGVIAVTQAEVDTIGNGQPWQPPCNRVITVGATATSYFLDGSGYPHWIPDVETYHCLTDAGYGVTGALPQEIVDALGNGQPWQNRCISPARARGHILSVSGGPSYIYDGTLHWLPGSAETFWCYIGRGWSQIGGLTQLQVDTLGGGQPAAGQCMDPGRAVNHVVRATDGTSYRVDGAGTWHYIPTGAIYLCLVKAQYVANGYGFYDLLNATWDEINSLKHEGAWATCAPPPPPPPAA
jgi:hypothetical protein